MAAWAAAKALRTAGYQKPLTMITKSSNGAFYSKPLLSHCASRNVAANSLYQANKISELERLSIKLLESEEVLSIDFENKVINCSGATQSYENLILATGASSLKLFDSKNVYSVNNLEDWEKLEQPLSLSKEVLIAGTGFVGLELSNDLVKSGKKVTVVSMELPLERLVPKEAASWILNSLRRTGIQFFFDKASIVSTDKGVRARLPSNLLEVEADIAISAVGIVPQLSLYADSGLLLGKHGVVVDNNFKTNKEGVYALGDLVEYRGMPWRFVSPINYGAKSIASNIVSGSQSLPMPAQPISLKCPDAPASLLLPFEPEDLRKGTWVRESSSQTGAEFYFKVGDSIKGYVLLGDCSRKARSVLAA